MQALYGLLHDSWSAWVLEAAWRDDTEDLGWGWDDAVSPEEETYRLKLVAEEAALRD